jgi:hypothetical protein
MYISREFYTVYQRWLAIAQEFLITDEETLALLAQWVANEQNESAKK